MKAFGDTGITFLKGVGPQWAELLQKELGIFTFGDLLNHFPFRYVDRTQVYRISEITADMPFIQLKGTLTYIGEVGQGPTKRLTAIFTDDSGSVDLVWFKAISWLKSNLKTGVVYTLFGKPSEFNKKINITHPELESEAGTYQPRFQPIYPSTEKLKQRKLDNRNLRNLMMSLFEHPSFSIPEILPNELLGRLNLINRATAYKWIHFPSNHEEMNAALNRLKFDELFLLQLSIQRLRHNRKKYKGLVFKKVGSKFNEFYYHQMNFELTEAQKRVIKEIRSDMATGAQMNRLLQGDVGSGKSIVAFLCILLAIDNGFQASIMAPTEILAGQHYEGFKEKMDAIGVNCALLTGSTKTKERRAILEKLANGEIDILIGTHALIEDRVVFKNQGLVVIDEQHRFGVAQRASLWQKDDYPPHVLVMTATPIPRTLAMTVYGDLDVSKIDELPGGRVPIITAIRREGDILGVRGFMKKEIDKGRQVYVVFPLIEESETLDYKNLNEGFDHMVYFFERPKYQVDMLHGKMKPAEKDAAMKRFKDGICHILVSTTVIEVGINVPNATVMVIENAEKFGLAQLHQLRGRVGRGADQSYCILMTGNKITKVAKARLQAMVESTDGFVIAEHDLKLRGPGDIDGTKQSGLLDLKLANIVKDEAILIAARDEAMRLLNRDPELLFPEHQALKVHFKSIKGYTDWSRVS